MRFKNDMNMMYATHDALRRDLDQIARVTARLDDDPNRLLRTALGWEMFKSYLRIHHTAEDDLLWPAMRTSLDADSSGAAMLDAMEAEHAAIDPLLMSIDAALADPDSGPAPLAELTDALAIAVRRHLEHEEAECLVLIDATVSDEQWRAFGLETGKRIGDDVQRFFPWALDEATPEIRSAVLAVLPAPMLAVYEEVWQPAYSALEIWP